MSTKNVNTVATITPGFGTNLNTEVVGGYTTQVGGGTYHGKGGSNITFDGMGIQHAAGDMGYTPNTALAEEVTLSTSGISAESDADGSVSNMVPKEGGNTFRGNAYGLFSGRKLQMSNLTDELRARGLTTTNEVVRVWDATFTLGGPIKRDKIWFFALFREWGNGGSGGGQVLEPDTGHDVLHAGSRSPGDRNRMVRVEGGRASRGRRRRKTSSTSSWIASETAIAMGTSGRRPSIRRNRHSAITSTRTGCIRPPGARRGRAGCCSRPARAPHMQSWPAEMQPGVTADHISIMEQSTGMTYNAATTYNAIQDVPRFTQRFSLSYVTGSHNFKTGIQLEQSIQNLSQEVHHDVNYRFNNRIPNQITQYATPWLRKNRKRDMGIYAQDQWAIRRLTLNYGLRFDYFYGYIPRSMSTPRPTGGYRRATSRK